MLVFFALAALLPPSDFGLIGMAAAWLALLSAFGETGFGAAIIHAGTVRRSHLSPRSASISAWAWCSPPWAWALLAGRGVFPDAGLAAGHGGPLAWLSWCAPSA